MTLTKTERQVRSEILASDDDATPEQIARWWQRVFGRPLDDDDEDPYDHLCAAVGAYDERA